MIIIRSPFDTLLHNTKLKKTPIRIEILAFMSHSNIPVDVSQISVALSHAHIKADPVTIFRNMNLFCKVGIAKVIDFHEGKFRYELATNSHHHHIICKTCGTIEDIKHCEMERIEELIYKEKRFQVETHALEFFGICRNCI